jgi:uncharacterized membrane protein YgaE (UPF0421/DUF939 family)
MSGQIDHAQTEEQYNFYQHQSHLTAQAAFHMQQKTSVEVQKSYYCTGQVQCPEL